MDEQSFLTLDITNVSFIVNYKKCGPGELRCIATYEDGQEAPVEKILVAPYIYKIKVMPQRVGHLHLYIDHLPYSPQEIQQIKMEQKAKKRSRRKSKQLQLEQQAIDEESMSRQDQQQYQQRSTHSLNNQPQQHHIQVKPVPQSLPNSLAKNCYTQSNSSNYLMPPNQYQCQFQPKQPIRSTRNYQAVKQQQQQTNSQNCYNATKPYASNSSFSNSNYTNSRSYVAVN